MFTLPVIFCRTFAPGNPNTINMEMRQSQAERQKIARRMASEYLAFLIDMEKLRHFNQPIK